MNAIPDLETLAPFPADWKMVFTAVNSWRGECMHHFSTVEHAVTQALLALDATKPEGATIRLRHLIGQRLEDLSEAIGSGGAFADAGKVASKALALFRERHEAFRTQLCHGHISVSVEPNGNWLLVIRTLSIRGRQADHGIEVISQAQAGTRLAELKRDGQKLTAALGQVRKAAVSLS